MTGTIQIRVSHETFYERIGIALEPGQREAVRVGFDGRKPAPGSPLFRFDNPPPDWAMRVLVMPCGVRSGKSRVFAAAKAVYQALTCDVSGLAPREQIVCSFIAPLQSKAQETLAYALGIVEAYFPDRLLTQAGAGLVEEFYFRSDTIDPVTKKPVRIRFCALAASSGGISARGIYHLNAVLEEYAFFRGDGSKVNDREVYNSVRNRLWKKGGRLQVISSPWAEEGHFYELYERNRDKPEPAVVASGATDVLRSDPETLALMAEAKAEYERNGALDLWAREWKAVFLSLGSKQHYDKDTLDKCGKASVDDVRPGDVVTAGIDLGFVHDHAALVIVRKRLESVEQPEGPPKSVARYAVVHVEEMASKKGEPLRPSEVCAHFAEVMRRFGAGWAMADVHYRESLREALFPARDAGDYAMTGPSLSDAPSDPAAPHVRARTLMREGLVDLLDDPRVRHQLSVIQRRPAGPGKIAIELPRGTTHGHCDIAAALALALYQAHGAEVATPEPERGSPEWLRAEEARLFKQYAEQHRRREDDDYGI